MPVEEYYVITNISSEGRDTSFKWNGAAAGSSISNTKTGAPFKEARLVTVQAETAAEAIAGVKQVFPGSITGTSFAILKSSLTSG
jgi:hypothetical protein